MSWVEHCIWWQVYPLGFAGAPIRDAAADARPPAGGGLPRLERWLDYAIELGASGLSLGPVFASSSHGYDSTDQFRIDPRLGDLEDFDRLVAACRERGLRVLLDGVFNHLGAQHPFVDRALHDGPDGPYAQFFQLDRSAPGAPRLATFEGHESLVALNHDSPQVAEYVASVMRYWLDRGIDGWRLDAAYAVDPAFWARVLPAVRAEHPAAWFVGEVIHGDYAGIVEASGLDSVTQYELWKAVWSSLRDGNFYELDWTLQRHNGFLDRFAPQTFVGNHDVTRIASQVGERAAVLALVVLMTTGGVPSVYYGDEQGLAGVKEDRLGGDDAVRPAFPARPDGIEGLAGRVGWMYRAHQDLIGLRRRHPWLVGARTEAVELSNTRYVYRVHSVDGDDAITVELDVTGAPRAVVRDAEGGVLYSFA